jgi:hypothetical protein
LHHFLPHLFGDITNISSLPYLPAATAEACDRADVTRLCVCCARAASGHAAAAPPSSVMTSRRFILALIR